MMHRSRLWQQPFVAGIEWLASELCEDGVTYTPCSAFRIRGTRLLLLNDATGPDGAQEYAVILVEDDPDARSLDGYQVESLTCSWMKRARLDAVLRELVDVAQHADAEQRFRQRCYADRVSWRTHPKGEVCRWCA